MRKGLYFLLLITMSAVAANLQQKPSANSQEKEHCPLDSQDYSPACCKKWKASHHFYSTLAQHETYLQKHLQHRVKQIESKLQKCHELETKESNAR